MTAPPTKKEILKAILTNQQIFMENLGALQNQVNKLRSEIHELIRDEVVKEIGDKINLIDAALTETIIHKEVLIEKGLLTREEVNEALRKRQQCLPIM